MHRWLPAVAVRARTILSLTGHSLWRGVVGIANSDDLTHAASIAYYALLSLFPFMLLVLSVIGQITADEESRSKMLDFVLRYFPTRFDFVTSQIDMFRQTRLRIGVAGGLALIWASLGVFGAITTAVNHAWGVEKQRSFLRHRMVSFLMLVAAGSVTIVALLLVTAVQVAEASWFGAMLSRFHWLTALQTLTFRYLSVILLTMAIGLVFYFIPNAKTRFRDVWVGAILTGLLWRATFFGFAWYIKHNSRLTMIQGSIAAVVVFLLWVYVSSIILLYGVEFTAAYARLRRRRPEDMPAAPTPRV